MSDRVAQIVLRDVENCFFDENDRLVEMPKAFDFPGLLGFAPRSRSQPDQKAKNECCRGSASLN